MCSLGFLDAHTKNATSACNKRTHTHTIAVRPGQGRAWSAWGVVNWGRRGVGWLISAAGEWRIRRAVYPPVGYRRRRSRSCMHKAELLSRRGMGFMGHRAVGNTGYLLWEWFRAFYWGSISVKMSFQIAKQIGMVWMLSQLTVELHGLIHCVCRWKKLH